MKEALALAKVKPLVIDYDDPEFAGAGRAARRRSNTRSSSPTGDPGLRLAHAGRRMGRDLAQLHLRHHRQSQGRGLSSSRRLPAGDRQRAHRQHGQASASISGRCRCSTATAGAFPWTISVVAGTHVCLRQVRAARDVRRHRRAQGHASVRRADRHVDAAQRAGRRRRSRCRTWSSSSPRRRRRPRPCWRR